MRRFVFARRHRDFLIRHLLVLVVVLVASGFGLVSAPPASAQGNAQAPAAKQKDIGWTYPVLIKMGLQQLALAQQLAKTDHDPVLIAPLEVLAATYATMGNYPKAVSTYQKILAIHEANLKSRPNQSLAGIIFTANKLGMMLQDRGRSHEAEPFVKRALQLRLGAKGAVFENIRQKVLLADLLNNLAVIYQAQGRFSEAEPLLKRALELHAKNNIPLKLALARNNLAELYVSIDRLQEAEKYHLSALKIRQELAPNSNDTAISLNNLGGLYQRMKRYKEAENHYQQALVIWRGRLGTRHPYVAIIRNNLAALFAEQKRYNEAARLNKLVLDVRLALLGPDHHLVAATYSNMAKNKMDQGRFAEAARLFNKSLAIDEQALKPNHPDIRRTLKRLVFCYGRLNRPDLATPVKARLAALPPPGMKYLPLYFVTNRHAETVSGKPSFGGKPAGRLSFGRAITLIPDTLIKRQGAARASAAGLLDRSTGKLTAAGELKLVETRPIGAFSEFAHDANKSLHFSGLFKDQILIFIHGYNVDFNEALARAAQISFDLEFDGLLMPFSWPSQGELSGYQSDEINAANAAGQFVSFLRELARTMPGKKVHIIAHSMGSRVLIRALQMLSRTSADWQSVFGKLQPGEIIWAHPDVDQKQFRANAGRIAALGAKMTLYSTRDDWALWASKLLHGRGRAGSELVLADGVDTIDISGMKAIDRGWFEIDLNHNVFVRNPALFGDITRLLLTGRRPVHQRSPDYRPVRKNGKRYWVYKPLELARN